MNNLSKKAAVWIDLTQARIYEMHLSEGVILKSQLYSSYDGIKRVDGEGNDQTRFSSNPKHRSNNEFRKNNIVKNEQDQFFSEVAEALESYEDILLFGPGTAKDRLKNTLAEIKAFESKIIRIQTSDKLTENQERAFVREQLSFQL